MTNLSLKIKNSSFSKYPAYKDSGVDWIGKIPEEWESQKLASFGRFSKGGGFSKADLSQEGVPAVLYGDIYTRYNISIQSIDRFVPEKIAVNAIAGLPNDLLFTGSGETLDEIGKCVDCATSKPLVIGGDVIIFRQSLCNPRFLSYIQNSNRIAIEKAKSSKGEIVVHTYASKLRELRVPIPPKPEQTSIANFLDEKTVKIDEAIRQKQRMIELLHERKQIIIQNAVTKGLDPNLPMKDSGIEWIGKIPAHWEVKRGKFLFFESDERSGTGDEELLSVSHISGVTPRSEKDVNMFLAEDYSGSKLCHAGDVVYNIMWAWMGALGVSPCTGIVSPSYGVYRQRTETFDDQYLEWLLQSLRFCEYYNKVSTGLHSSRLRFYSHMFMNMFIGFPPLKEQRIIVGFVTKNSERIDSAILETEQQIEKLKEYRATLIDSAVTGKINVSSYE
ncbi:MAG: restriction endonuclease subunit S [Verrucomicrobiales bacterium]|nr:restriction endonuclease subunit S [Verrucomicrobiales bacterium]